MLNALFVPGKIAQTSLSPHHINIHETNALKENGYWFLVFAKAFDNAINRILLNKVAKQNTKGKQEKCTKEFPTNKKYKVMANRIISDEDDVLSDVPKGMEFASILFTIMIPNTDREVKESTL